MTLPTMRSGRLWLSLWMIGAFTVTSSCSKPTHKKSTSPEISSRAEASHNIADSFVVTPPQRDDPESTYRIGIKRPALEKEFLMRANLIKGGTAPAFENLKSRIVVFSLKDGKVFLVEASAGHAYHSDLPQSLILASFPIISEEDEVVYFDFNMGMSRLYTMSDWYAADLDKNAKHVAYADQFKALSIDLAFIKEAKLGGNNDMLIFQAAQLNEDGSLLPVEVRYLLAPYQPSPNFEPVASPDKTRLGFFEVNPEIDATSHQSVVHAAKFSLEKPIVFAISDNTPSEYRASIREGALYWNKAFGRSIVEVVEAPSGVSAPSYEWNVIQWVDWQEAGYAYADAQMDPRTGQVLNAQVFLPSAFAFSGKSKARELLRGMMDRNFMSEDLAATRSQTSFMAAITAPQAATPPAEVDSPAGSHLTLKGFSSDVLCRKTVDASLAGALAKLLSVDAPDGDYLKLSQDYVRSTVTHEVGHTLGLRHNFAGMHAANYDFAERQRLLDSYLQEGRAPDGLIATSTVMDYLMLEEELMVGEQIKREADAFPYDRMAIAVLYEGAKLEDFPKAPLFCTDSHVATYVDCERSIAGRSPLAYAKWQHGRALQDLSRILVEYFISHAKSPAPGQKAHPLSRVRLSTAKLASSILAGRAKALRLLVSGQHALQIDRAAETVDEVHRAELDSAFANWVQAELTQTGGWGEVLDQIPEDFGERVAGEFARLIESPAYRRGVGPGGAYEFDDAEIASMQATVRAYLPQLEKALAERDIVQLFLVKDISDQVVEGDGGTLGDTFANYLANKALRVIGQSTGEAAVSLVRVKVAAEVSGVDRLIMLQSLALQGTLPTQLQKLEGEHPNEPISPAALKAFASRELAVFLDHALAQADVQAALASMDRKAIVAQMQASRAAAARAQAGPGGRIGVLRGVAADVNTWVEEAQQAVRLAKLRADKLAFPGLVELASKWHPTSLGRIDDAAAEMLIDDDMEAGEEAREASPELDADAEASDDDSATFVVTVPIDVFVPLALPEFKYSYELRVLAAKLLETKRGEGLDFAMSPRKALRDAFATSLVGHMRGLNILQVDVEEQPKQTNVWVQQNRAVLASFRDGPSLGL